MKTEVLYRKEAAGKLGGRLTIVSAPAGFGKTTLIREWSGKQSFPVAWLTLRKTDREWNLFWQNVTAAFKRATGYGDFEEADPDAPSAIVIDDCQVVDSRFVTKMIRELIKKTPPSLKVIIISRHQLSVSEAAVEITGEDLRFNEIQSRQFFEDRIGGSLNEEIFTKLHSWTHGWGGGMMLLSLVVQEYGGPQRWFEKFYGEHPYLTDYFTNEVWENESLKVRNFLLQTVVAETFDGSLCEALTGEMGHEKLRDIIHRQLFVESDGGIYWYEPLFSAFLQRELRSVSSRKQRRWLLRASEWFAEQGRGATAIDLALKAGDDVRAGSLILRFAPDLLKHAQWEDAQRWIGLLGRVEGKQKARMMLFYCWMYFLKGAFAGLSEFVQETEKQITACGLPPEYKGELMLLRSFTAFAIKDVEGAVDRIDEAVSLLADRTVYLDGEMRLNIAEAQTIRGTIGLRGRLSKVIHYLKHFKKHRSLAPETFAGYAHTVGAETAYEINRLDEARYSAEKAFNIAKKQENASMLVPAAIVFSQILRNYKSYREGHSVIREAGKWVNGNGRRWELMLIAQEVRLLLGQGRIREAERLFYEQILHAKDGQEGLHEFESLTYVRVLIAAKAFDQAELLLEQLLFEAESHDRFGTRIEILVLQAVVCQKVNRIQKGMEVLKEAIELAEEEGYTRTFLDEGQPIHILFERIGRGRSPYVRKLLDLFDETPQHSVVSVKLTKRERDVLRMMGDGFTNKEMAEEINVTIGTVKGYASTLFRKLGVRSRTHAVARGREMDLLNSHGKNA